MGVHDTDPYPHEVEGEAAGGQSTQHVASPFQLTLWCLNDAQVELKIGGFGVRPYCGVRTLISLVKAGRLH
jgi:hypothetical protein